MRRAEESSGNSGTFFAWARSYPLKLRKRTGHFGVPELQQAIAFMPDPNQPDKENQEEDAVELDSQSRDVIGEKLKDVYADIVNQPVPDRFRELLDQLEAGDQPKAGEQLSSGEKGGSEQQ